MSTSGTGTGNIIGSSTTASTLTVAGTNNTFGGIIQDVIGANSGQTLSLAISGSGNSLTLAGNSTYTGSTTVPVGATLQLGNGGTAGSINGTNIINLDGTLIFNRSDTLTINSPISASGPTGAVQQVGAGTTVLAANNTYAGTTTISAGTLQIGNGGTAGNLVAGGATNNVVDNGTLDFNRSDFLTVGQVISGTGSLVKDGDGTVLLSAFNTYTGGTTVNAGILQLSAGNNGTGAIRGTVNINNGGTLQIVGHDVFGYTSAAVAVNVININKGGVLDQEFNNNETVTGVTINMTGGTISAGTGFFQFFSNGFGNTTLNSLASDTTSTISSRLDLRNANLNSTFTVASGTTPSGVDLLVSGQITQNLGGSGITKAGLGKMLLTAVNTYTGTTTVNQGTLSLGSANGINVASPLILGGGKFDTGGLNQALNTLVMAAPSVIDMGSGASVLTFADSHSIGWADGTLSVVNWTGTANTPGGTDQLIFGTTSGGLNSTQLGQIHFQGFNGATILGNGEVVPVTASARMLGDFDVNGVVNSADITAMLKALTDLNAYQLATSPLHLFYPFALTNDDLLNIGDVNLSGSVTNADIQAELDLVAAGPGAGSVAGVPEPASWLLLAIGGALLLKRRSFRKG